MQAAPSGGKICSKCKWRILWPSWQLCKCHAMLSPNLFHVTETISGSVVPLAMFWRWAVMSGEGRFQLLLKWVKVDESWPKVIKYLVHIYWRTAYPPHTHTHNAQINTCFCGGVSLTMAYVCTVISHKYEAPDVCIGRMPYIRRICSAGCPHSCQDFSSKATIFTHPPQSQPAVLFQSTSNQEGHPVLRLTLPGAVKSSIKYYSWNPTSYKSTIGLKNWSN